MIMAMRERQKADREKLEAASCIGEGHEAAMQAMMNREEETCAAMQAFEIKVAARRVYHEAPDDVFELIVCFDYLQWMGMELERAA
jgi:hypothetical protein